MNALSPNDEQAADAAAGEHTVELGEQQQPTRLVGRDQLLGGDRLVRDDPALDRRPRLEVPELGCNAQVDHPDRFSFPCCFA